jgi:hypothetical protein
MRSTSTVPPSIDGYTYERPLGGGGFADVYLYRHDVLERHDAVKVLRQTVDDEDTRALFVAEANLMAKVSAHPNIVTIHTAGVSRDRRAYMVMEYYPQNHYGIRLEAGPIPVAQVLAIGIKIAGAVDYAHQARVIHRDIKPANILAGREPALTDFGISAVHSDIQAEVSRGYSPAYSPKEILENSHPGDARSDVYSLAATLWAMLVGRAPFERPEGSSRSELVARGINDPVPRLPADLTPDALELVLRRALDKDPDRRPQTARDLGRQLQSIERELGHPESRLVLFEDDSSLDSAVAQVVAAVERTKRGGGVVIDLTPRPEPRATEGRVVERRFDLDPDAHERVEQPAPAPGPGTTPRGTRSDREPTPAAELRAGTTPRAHADKQQEVREPVPEPAHDRVPRRRGVIVAAAVAAGLVAALVAFALLGGGSDARPPAATTADGVDDVVNPGAPNELTLGPVTNLTGARDGDVVTFDWEYATRDGLDFIVQRVDLASEAPVFVDGRSLEIRLVSDDEAPCVTVTARIQGVAQSETSAPVCVGGASE